MSTSIDLIGQNFSQARTQIAGAEKQEQSLDGRSTIRG
jgi:hypothetical protein